MARGMLLLLIVLSLQIASGLVPSISKDNLLNSFEKVSEEFDLNTYTEQWLESCENNNNGTEASINIQESLHALSDCVTSKINVFNISEEIKAAMPKGALDEVFTSYCNLVPEIKHCRAPMISALQVCLSDQGDQDLEIADSAIDGGLDFLCYKGGERIAIFLAENGTECFLSNADRIASCLNETVPQMESLLKDLQRFNISVFDADNCGLEAKMKACVIDGLKTCSDPTPANVVEGLIDSMIKRTPCHKNGSHALNFSSLTWIMIVFISVYSSVFKKF